MTKPLKRLSKNKVCFSISLPFVLASVLIQSLYWTLSKAAFVCSLMVGCPWSRRKYWSTKSRKKSIWWLIRSFCLAPTPRWHWLALLHGVFRKLGINYRQSCTPLQVANKCRSELRITFESHLVGGFKKKQHPPFSLLLRQHFANMLPYHFGMTGIVDTCI